MLNGKNLRLALIAIFVILFGWGLIAVNKAEAATHEAVIGLGVGIIHTDDSYKSQTIGYRYNRKWGIDVSRTGEVFTEKSDTVRLEETYRLAFVRYVHWREGKFIEPFLRFGFDYWVDKPAILVNDNLCFDMAVGAELGQVAQIGWHHCSTAGRTDPNSGQDEIQLRFNMRF